MAVFEQYNYLGVRYVHCGDDFWRPYASDRLQWGMRFTNEYAIKKWIENRIKIGLH
jgi:hypothetical protein